METDEHRNANPNLLKGKLHASPSQETPQIKWQCPPKFILDPNWHVAAGEESTEVAEQSRRQLLLEAGYLSHSVVSSPSRPVYVADYHDDSNTPEIPLSPIEEEKKENLSTDTAAPAISNLDQAKDSLASRNLTAPNVCPEIFKQPALEDDIMAVAAAGAAAAITAYRKCRDEGTLIDRDLLIKLLHNPETVSKLITEHAQPAYIPVSVPNDVTPSVPLPSSQLDQMVRVIENAHGVPARTGVHMSTLSGAKGMTHVSCGNIRPECEMMSLIGKCETTSRATTIPLIQATKTERSAPASINPSIAFPRSNAEGKLSSVATTPRPPLLSLDMKHEDEGSLIDTKLLMLLLNNPEILQNLIGEHLSAYTSKTASMLNEAKSSFPLHSEIDQVMKLSANEHGARAKTGVHISEPVAMIPVSFSGSRPELNIMKLKNTHEPPPIVAAFPVTCLPPSTRITTHEPGASSSTRPSRYFPSFKPELDIMNMAAGNVQSPAPAAAIPRSRLIPLPRATAINEHTLHVQTSVPFSIPKTMTPSASLPSSIPEPRIMNLTGENVSPPELTTTTMSPILSQWSSGQDPALLTSLLSELIRYGHSQSTQFGCSTPVESSAPLPNPVCDVSKLKQLVNEYGASDRTEIQPVPEQRLMMPPVLYDQQHSILQIRPLPTDTVYLPTMVGGSAPLTMPESKLVMPSVSIPTPRTNAFALPMTNAQPTANELQFAVHANPIQNMNLSTSMPMHQKHCMFFNSSRGCRNGSRCRFLHIRSDRPTPSGVRYLAPSAKRMKPDGETSGSL